MLQTSGDFPVFFLSIFLWEVQNQKSLRTPSLMALPDVRIVFFAAYVWCSVTVITFQFIIGPGLTCSSAVTELWVGHMSCF